MVTLDSIYDLIVLLDDLGQIELLCSLNNKWIILVDNYQTFGYSPRLVTNASEETNHAAQVGKYNC